MAALAVAVRYSTDCLTLVCMVTMVGAVRRVTMSTVSWTAWTDTREERSGDSLAEAKASDPGQVIQGKEGQLAREVLRPLSVHRLLLHDPSLEAEQEDEAWRVPR